MIQPDHAPDSEFARPPATNESEWQANSARLAEMIAALWQQNRERVLDDIKTLENTVTSWLSDTLQPEERRAAERTAHKLAGGLGTYGFTEGSRLAKRIETALEGDEDPDQHQLLQVCSTMLALSEEMQKEQAPQLEFPVVAEPGLRDPVPEASPPEHPTPARETMPVGPVPDETTAEAAATAEMVPGLQETRPRVEHVDIVVVDDDPILAELLVQSLKMRGYEVRWLSDGQAAVDQLAGQFPELSARLIVLDVDMPGMDGLSVLTRLSREKVLIDTQVLMLTARSTETEMLRAFKLGAKDHVSKPFSLPVLTERVRRLLGD